ncbi:MAG: hypothetical protein ACT4QF_16610 [Sporichthyaceae bacterium]
MSDGHSKGRHRGPSGAKRARRRLAATAAVTVLTPVVATFGVGPADAADTPPAGNGGGTFSGRAAADGVRLTLSVKDYLIVEDFVDGGGPTARATLDSLGESTAFSSLPYPGESGVAVPGLISTVSGKSVPSYPFIVSSQFPSRPSDQVSQPGYLMKAESGDSKSAAQTSAGATTANGEEFGSFSTAGVDAVNGTITSTGEARTRFAIGAFALNGAVSKASIVRTPDGKVIKKSSFEASAIRLGDLLIGVTEKGLIVGSESTPLDPASAVSESITSSGITVSFLPAVQTKDSVLSSGLVISTEQPLAGVGNARGVVSYIVGRTFAQAQSAGFGGSTTGGATTTTPVAPPATEVPVAVLAPEPETPIDLRTSTEPFPVPQAAPAAVPAAAAPAAEETPPTVQFQNAAAEAPPLTELEFYPLLVALVPILLLAAYGARRFV